jgi:triphosphoribosyl-dephospho-CoA synthase
MRTDEPLDLFAQAACLWEATARKPGNVHRFADFGDLGYLDFALSAAAVGRVLAAAPQSAVGWTVLEAVRRTRAVVRTNTNLGILLLLAPLAKAAREPDLRTGLARVLAELTVEDAELVYQAIRLAAPGGLGRAPEQDVSEQPTRTLREVMILAQGRDLIARQFANGFREVFEVGIPALEQGLRETATLEGAIIWTHLHLLAVCPDSLIGRKRGAAEAGEASRQALRVLKAGWPRTPSAWSAFRGLDAWLRGEGHGRNPGSTADLVTGCLFLALREGVLALPSDLPWAMRSEEP